MLSHSPWFHSEESGGPFRHCIHCRMPLAEIDSPWLVTKDYRRDECILEYAICQPCRNEVALGFSEESKSAVRDFLENEIDWSTRVSEFMMERTVEKRMEACICCRTPRGGMTGFGLSALFDSGGNLVEGPLPLILCDQCMARLISTLSESTRAAWRAFLSTHFDGPPDLEGGGYSGLI